MGIDYYNILSLTRGAEDADIKKAYRKLALKLHPQKNPDDPLAMDKFRQIAEAYEVLNDPRKRAVYDQFGEEGLKHGVPKGMADAGAWTDGYTFHNDPFKVFHEFFGGDNPYQEFFDRVDGDMTMSFGGLYGRGRKKQDPPNENELTVTLEEVYRGCVKKMRVARRVLQEDGHTSNLREKVLTVHIRPGWLPGFKIRFEREGHQGPNTVPADVVFTLVDRPHPRFRRDGSNLIHTATIPLLYSLVGCTIDVQTLDDRILHVPINDIVRPGFTKVVPGEGMPLPNNPEKKGDLIIDFNIEFPERLSSDQKVVLEKAFTLHQ